MLAPHFLIKTSSFFIISFLFLSIVLAKQIEVNLDHHPHYADLTDLQKTIVAGKLDLVEKLLSQPRDADDRVLIDGWLRIDYRNKKEGMTALLLALLSGYSKVAMSLLRFKADPTLCDLNGICPIHIASRNNDVEVLILIKASKYWKPTHVDVKDNSKMTPLHYAAQSGSVLAAAWLIRNGADVGALNMNGHPPIFQATMDFFDSFEGKAEMVNYLISQGSPLCELDQYQIHLVNFALTNFLTPVDHEGKKRAFEKAERFSKKNIAAVYEVIKALLEKGCEANIAHTPEKPNALWRVIGAIHIPLMEISYLLIKHGASIGVSFDPQETPFYPYDAISTEDFGDFLENQAVRFLFLPVQQWTTSDVQFWLDILSKEHYADIDKSEQVSQLKRRVTKEGIKGKFLAENKNAKFLEKISDEELELKDQVDQQLKELKNHKRSYKAFPYFWDEYWHLHRPESGTKVENEHEIFS